MGTSYRIEDLLGDSAGAAPEQRREGGEDSYRVEDLLADSSASPAPAPAPARAPIAPARGPAPSRAASMASEVMPRVRRGVSSIGRALGGLLGEAGAYGPGQEQSAGTTASRYEEPEGEYGLERPVDRRVPVPARRRAEAQIAAPSDVTRVAPAGSRQQSAERSATQAGLQRQATNERNFTPKNLRDVARRGDLAAEELHRKADEMAATDAVAAQAMREQADAMRAKASNAETIASASENADTFSEIARSSLLGIIHDPNAPAKRAMLEYASDPALSFTPEEQTRDLGKNLPVGTARGFDVTKDVAAPLVGSLPLYVAGGLAGRAATRAVAGGLEALNAPRAARIARALATEIESTGIYGPKQAGVAGLREAGANFLENAPRLAARGAVEGQVVGAAQAAREAQQVGGDPIQAAAMSAVMGAPFGAVAELGGGAFTRLLGVADRSIAGALDRVVDRVDPRGISRREWMEAIGTTNPPEPQVVAAMDEGATAAGKTPVSDKTLEGQRNDLARALEEALAAKREAPNFGSEAGLIERDPGYLTPTPSREEPDVPLRSARDLAMERTGGEPTETPRDQVDATKQMQRAADEARLMEQQVIDEQESLRVEQAAQARDAEAMGPFTLGETIERAGRDRDAGEPLAAEYHDAISKFADAQARMADATADDKTPSTKLKLDYARARTVLNEARRKYGQQAGAAVLATVAAHDSDLTDEERQWLGIGAAVMGTTALARRMPQELRNNIAHRLALSAGMQATPMRWLEHLSTKDIELGDHYQPMRAALERAAAGDPNGMVGVEQVREIVIRLASDEPQSTALARTAPIPATFISRLGRAVETLPGKAWDAPRPVADWMGKLKGLSTFSKAEYALVEPALKDMLARKEKIDRAGLLALVDAHAPQIRQESLGTPDTPASAPDNRFDADAGDANEIRDITDIAPNLGREVLQQQMDNRAAAIEHYERDIEQRIASAEQERDQADADVDRAMSRLRAHMDEAWPDADVSAGYDAAVDYLREHVEAEHVPRGTVDKAYARALEEGGLTSLDEPRDPSEFDLEVDRTDDGGYVVRHDDGREWTAPTRGEALAAAEQDGAYNSGSSGPLLPDGLRVVEEEVPRRAKWRVTRPDGSVASEGFVDHHLEEIGEEALRQKVRDNWGDNVTITDLTPPATDTPQKQWVAYVEDALEARHVVHRGEAGGDRESMIDSLIEDRFDPPNSEQAFSDLRDRIDSLADEIANYQRAESEHYWMAEGEAFEQEYGEIETWRSEIDEIEGIMEDAPDHAVVNEIEPTTEAPEAEAMDPLLVPVPSRVSGSAKFSSYQRIGGGTEYVEHLNVWENNPGEKYGGGHWSEEDTVSHVRMETHTVDDTPGLTGEKVEYFPGEPEDARVLRSQIDEKRKHRAEQERALAEIARQYEALPADQQQGTEAYALASEYQTKANQIKTIADRETELARKLRDTLGSTTGEAAPRPKRVRVVIESQSDLAQDAAKYGIKRVLSADERTAYAAAAMAVNDEEAALNTERDGIENQRERLQEDWRATRRELVDGGAQYDEIGDVWDYLPGNLDPANRARELARLNAINPHLAELVHLYGPPAAALTDVNSRLTDLRIRQRDLDTQYGITANRSAVAPSPYADTKVAHGLNAARSLMDAANRGFDSFAWSDGANRVRMAHLPIAAATLTYDKLFPSAVKTMLAHVGFKDVKLEHIYIRGYGHWKIDLTPAMRAAIRKHGLPMLGVMGALAMSSNEASAQGVGANKADLYKTGAGGIAAGLLLATMMGSKRLRSLVKENRELSRALHMDDLSGLSNKRALTRAIESVDADPEVGWITLDGNSFKKLNDTHGHPEGDKAIAHFGRVLREVAAEMKLPMRGFRAGGDEFAFAAPKEKLAEVMREIEQRSGYTKGDVTTSLTGAYADTYAAADAMLTAEKARTRVPRQASRALDLYSNPIGPALRELRRAPGAAGLAVIGTLASQEEDNEYVRRAGLPILAIAALHAIGSRRLAAGGDKLASGLVEQLRKTRTGTSAVRAFNPDRLVPKEALTAIRQFERDRAKSTAQASEMAMKAKKLGPSGDRAVSDVLDREGWEGMAAQTPEVLAVAIELADAYDRATKAQVAAGTLDVGDVLPNYGGPRKYAHYEVAHALADKPGRGGGPSASPKIAKTKTRTLDIPIREAERALADAHAGGDPAAIKSAQEALDLAEYESAAQRVERGEIREASYRAAAGLEKAHHNVAAAKLFETLRATPGVAHPEWIQAVDDYQAATALKRSVRGGTQADIDAAEILVGNATAKLDEIGRRFKQKGQDYKTLPDDPGWGMLRGAVVQRDVAHSLEGFGEPGVYGRMHRSWKELKTVFNPGTHMGNVASNTTTLHTKGLPVWLQGFRYKAALKDLQSYGEAARAMTEAGVMHVNSVNAEGQAMTGSSMRSAEGLEELLATTRPETADVIRRESEANSEHAITEPAIEQRRRTRLKKGLVAGAAIGAAASYDDEHPERMALGAAAGAGLGALAASRKGDVIRRVYGHEDNLARMAFFIHRRKAGDTIEEATQAAIDVLGDFRTRSPALRLLGRTVSPFIMYQAKAVPAFAKSIIDHPYRYLSLVAAWAAMDEYAKREVGEIPEEDRDVRDRATWGYFFPGMTQLPITNPEGDKGATDVSRYTPFGGLATGAPPGTLPDALSENAPSIATPGGPAIDLALRAANIHPLTRQPLVNRDAPLRDNIGTLLREATDFALPSALGFHRRQITADYDNRDFDKFKNDILGPLGSKPRFVRQGAPQDRADYELDRRLNDLNYQRERDLDANKNPAREDYINEKYDRLEDMAEENYERRTTPPAKGARP